MRQWRHSAFVIRHILKNVFPYSKWQLLLDYLRLLISAYLKSPASTKIKKVRLLGFSIFFRDRAELINLFEEIFIYQVYKVNLRKKNPAIADCGSHIGLATLYFLKLFPGATVLCFEPNRDNFDLLKETIKGNGFDSVKIYPFALSDADRSGVLYASETRSIKSGLIESNATTTVQEVNLRRLSAFITTKLDLLKVDVEGAEERILQDLLSTGKLKLIDNIVMEYHPDLTGSKSHRMTDLLARGGYQCAIMKDDLHPGASEVIIHATKANAD